MRPSEALRCHLEEVRRIIESHRVCNPRVIGSVQRGEDSDRSDLDILLDPMLNATLFDIGAIQMDLEELLGVPVDVVTPGALPESFRKIVLAGGEPI